MTQSVVVVVVVSALLGTTTKATPGDNNIDNNNNNNDNTQSSYPPTFLKCCKQDSVFSVGQKACRRLSMGDDGSQEMDGQEILPVFASVHFASQNDYYHHGEEDYYYHYSDSPVDETPPFKILEGEEVASTTFLPVCSEKKEDLVFRMSPRNEASQSTFVIDDQAITNTPNILIDLTTFDNHTNFCLERGFSDNGGSSSSMFLGTVAVFCESKPEIVCHERPCVSHCCPSGLIMNSVTNHCDYPVNENASHNLPPVPLVTQDGTPSDLPQSRIKIFSDSVPGCLVHTYETFQLLENGHIDAGGGGIQNHTHYCLAQYEIYGPQTGVVSYQHKALVCVPEDPFSDGHLKWVKIIDLTVVPILFMVSLVFLALLFAYVWIKNRNKLFGVMTLCLTAMLVLFYACLITSKITGASWVRERPSLCIALGLLIQYFYLSAIFWLNAMSFDIWCTFR